MFFMKLCIVFFISCSFCNASSSNVFDKVVRQYVPNKWGAINDRWAKVPSDEMLKKKSIKRKFSYKFLKSVFYKDKLSNALIAIIFDDIKCGNSYCSIEIEGFLFLDSDDMGNHIRLRDSYLYNFDSSFIYDKFGSKNDFDGYINEFVFSNALISNNVLDKFSVWDFSKNKKIENCSSIKKVVEIGVQSEFDSTSNINNNLFFIIFQDPKSNRGVLYLDFNDTEILPMRCELGFHD